jgi:hypothetical protein
MSLNYTTVGSPFSSQSGAIMSDVSPVKLGCETGNSSSTHTVPTVVQTGLARKKTRRSKNGKKGKKMNKSGKRKYKRTMNKRRKAHTSKRTKKTTRKHKKVNQVGRGASYENVLTPMPGMGPQGAVRADVVMANTSA